eukprot:CAMPEP_0202699290 /NCGR_PEP_ID=MMETSP1385-20130828/12507_1 /ASSEMBLY_ACC=CAM_ASM_000861 /TAXON_ID=933848 /ORGANISM="Elphidium margaritaceum" /LENGTH=975 /DNA_ID=CAMNT_0049356189 /DNA_START=42 /DNA_END=2969 /DNA_ORIENTATION=-
MERSQWQPMNTYSVNSMNSIHALNQHKQMKQSNSNINQHVSAYNKHGHEHGSFNNNNMHHNRHQNQNQNQNQNGLYRPPYNNNNNTSSSNSSSNSTTQFPPYAQMKPTFPRTRPSSSSFSLQDNAFLSALYSALQHQFREFPILLQAFLTAVIAFVAYFFYDYASGLPSWRSYLLYRVVSLALFLVSVVCLYAVYQNLTTASTSSSSSSGSNLRAPFTAVPPPPPQQSSMMHHPLSTNQNLTNRPSSSSSSSSSLSNAGNKRDDLYFTKKQLNRAASSSASATSSFTAQPKYDFDSSPTKIASYDPKQIVNQAQLNSLFQRQQQQQQRAPRFHAQKVPLTPSAANTPITSMLHASKTPIGKTFGSMRMTPAVPGAKTVVFNTPIKLSTESVNLYTPISSNMDVTMQSYNGETDPFSNLDYSAIQPTPPVSHTAASMRPKAMAWDVSGFGAAGGGGGGGRKLLTDLSTLAQPGTPAKHDAYDYGGMYTDMNLRGDRIAAVSTKPVFAAQPASIAANVALGVSRAPPTSPFARGHERGRHQRRLDAQQAQSLVNPVVFTTMGLKKSQFAASYMEKSIKLYQELHIDGLIENWAESMRWWLAEMVKNRCQDLLANNADIDRIFTLLQQKYGIMSQLSGFKTASQKESFVLANEQQLMNVARDSNNASIVHIVQKRKHLKECVEFVIEPYKALHQPRHHPHHQAHRSDNQTSFAVTDYVYTRMQTLASSNNLNLYAWNQGAAKLFVAQKFPNDADLVMTLFCKYMDDAMCPAIQFSQRHYLEVTLADMHRVDRLHKRFKDVAIVCVSDAINLRQTGIPSSSSSKHDDPYNRMQQQQHKEDDITAHDSLPYFFIAYNKKKFESVIQSLAASAASGGSGSSGGIQKPKHFLQNAWDYFGPKKEEKSELSDDDYVNAYQGHKKHHHRKHSDAVGTWYPQPGKNNLLHTITLFALFLHKCCNDKLADIALKDQGCTLLEPLFK